MLTIAAPVGIATTKYIYIESSNSEANVLNGDSSIRGTSHHEPHMRMMVNAFLAELESVSGDRFSRRT